MLVKRNLIITLVVGLLALLAWYLFIKPYDYKVSFKTKANTGTINQCIKLWHSKLNTNQSLKQEKLNSLIQTINTGDSSYVYTWEIKPVNDSVNKVNVYVLDKNHSLYNKLTVPFVTTNFVNTTLNTVKQFATDLKDHLKNIKITIKGEDRMPSKYCAYISLKSLQIEKAKGMMKHFTFLESLLYNNGAKPDGYPFIEVTHWDIETDSINYNFCFPILKSDSLPQHELIQYKHFSGGKALKAIYNGNYITSDRAWYALLDYATKNNYEFKKNPVEVFNNNPNFGGDALQWKTEVYLPLIN